MSILVDHETRYLIQGMTGRIGSYHAERMLSYGSSLVAGVTPGKGGEELHGVPIFNTVKDAVAATGATASVLMVPPPSAADAIMEAAEASLDLCIALTDGMPAHDMIRVKRYMRTIRREKSMRLLGPNSSGVISPGKALLGIMPAEIFDVGHVGIIGRSGTLSYEAASQMQEQGIGVSSSVGIGGDAISGSTFSDIMSLFEADDDTHLIVIIGEIGGSLEAEAAEFIEKHATKPVVAYIAGLSAPKGRTMGHAGAIISAFGESADEKVERFKEAGAVVVSGPSEIGATVAERVRLLSKSQ